MTTTLEILKWKFSIFRKQTSYFNLFYFILNKKKNVDWAWDFNKTYIIFQIVFLFFKIFFSPIMKWIYELIKTYIWKYFLYFIYIIKPFFLLLFKWKIKINKNYLCVKMEKKKQTCINDLCVNCELI